METTVRAIPPATESDAKSDKTQSSILLTCIGQRECEIFNTFQFDSIEDRMKVDLIMEKFDHFCRPRKNITMLRHKLFIGSLRGNGSLLSSRSYVS